MVDEEIRTYPFSLEETENGITVSIPWVQRHANGAVIARVHMYSPKHTAGELLLNEGDVIALDQDERPLRTQVRRFWGYTSLGDIAPAHMQTARFDVGFRVDLAATGGHCGLAIAIIRTFRPGEGPKAAGGPWVFRFTVADDAEIAAAIRAEADRAGAAQREASQREAAQREAAERDAAQREAARQARLRADAERAAQVRTRDTEYASEPRSEVTDGIPRLARAEGDEYGQGLGRGRRLQRFGQPERGPRGDERREPIEATADGPEPETEPEPAPRAPVPRDSVQRGSLRDERRIAEAAIMGPAETAAEAVGEAEPAPAAPKPARTRAPRAKPRPGPRATSASAEPAPETPEGESGSQPGDAE